MRKTDTKNGSAVCRCGHIKANHLDGIYYCAHSEKCGCNKYRQRKAAKRKPQLAKAFEHWKLLEIKRECKRLGLVVLTKKQADHVSSAFNSECNCETCLDVVKAIDQQLLP